MKTTFLVSIRNSVKTKVCGMVILCFILHTLLNFLRRIYNDFKCNAHTPYSVSMGPYLALFILFAMLQLCL